MLSRTPDKAHARRYFVKALDGGDAHAALPIGGYKKLYEIEAEIRDKDEDAKRVARQARSKEVFDDIVAWCQADQPNEPPSSALGKAIQYALNHREALGRFLEHGAIPIDNGIVERLHVRAALTRKNFLALRGIEWVLLDRIGASSLRGVGRGR